MDQSRLYRARRRNPHALNRYSWVLGNPLGFRDSTGHCPFGIGYGTCRWGVNVVSSIGLMHGRNDVRHYQATIAALAVEYQGVDAILVAAAIAHQASDYKERPFGWDWLDKGWASVKNVFMHKPASQGIAQLRPDEMERYVGRGADPYDPEGSIRAMYGKVAEANDAILARDPFISTTDRYMLLAIAQNSQSGDPIGIFFAEDGGWSALKSNEQAGTAWTDLLQLVYIQLEWAIAQGWWEAPEDLDLELWHEIAFGDED